MLRSETTTQPFGLRGRCIASSATRLPSGFHDCRVGTVSVGLAGTKEHGAFGSRMLELRERPKNCKQKEVALSFRGLTLGELFRHAAISRGWQAFHLDDALGLLHRDVVAEQASDVRRHHAHELRGSDDAGAAERSASRVEVAVAAAAHAAAAVAADSLVGVGDALDAELEGRRRVRGGRRE
eukprot:scaffold4178_cov257-Pinguiococcus_pyrenoidosus.AAC.1